MRAVGSPARPENRQPSSDEGGLGKRRSVRAVIHDEADDRKADQHQAQRRRDGLAIALEFFAVFNGGRVRRRGRGLRRQLRNEILNRAIGIEAHFLRVGADEGARENTARQARQIAALERFERHHGNAGADSRFAEEKRPAFHALRGGVRQLFGLGNPGASDIMPAFARSASAGLAVASAEADGQC